MKRGNGRRVHKRRCVTRRRLVRPPPAVADDSGRLRGSTRMVEEASTSENVQPVVGEARWPMAAAVLAVIVLTLLLPHSLVVRPRWGVPIVECVLLVAVIIGDPGKIDRRSRPVRALSITLIALLVATTLWCTTQLIDGAHPGRIGHGLRRVAAGRRRHRLAVQLHRLRPALLGARQRRAGRPRPRAAGPSRLRLPAAALAGARPEGLAAAVRRLPLPRLHLRHRVQPDGRHAAAPVEQDSHDGPVHHLAGPAGPRDRPRRERPDVKTGFC